MLAKVEKRCPLTGPSILQRFLLSFCLDFTFTKMLPKTAPCQTMLGKVGKLMAPDKAANFPKIHVKVLSLASLFQKWSPRPSLAKPCWGKLEKRCPLARPAILEGFLMSFCLVPAFSIMLPKTTPCQTMLGKVEKLMPPDKATNFPKIHAEVFYFASLFPLWFPRPPPAKQC